MKTLYEMFKVDETATFEEIKNSYENIIEKANQAPKTDENIEKIRRIKIAFGILSNPEKRKKYDEDLSIKRANELIENIQVKENNQDTEKDKTENIDEDVFQINKDKIMQEIERQIKILTENDLTNLDPKDAKKIEQSAEKEHRKQIRKEKRQAKKDANLKKEKAMYEYGAYLEKQGYKVKYPWTWLRIKRLFIAIISVIITFIILWNIPFVNKILKDLYNNNFVIKFLVDIILSIFNRNVVS